LALLHFSCAAAVGIRKKFHLTGGLEAKAEVTVPPLDDWEKEWERAENVESGKRKVEMCNQSCCRWISGRRWLPSRNRISAGKWIGVREILQN
jgi:hypothetical protein